jgi:hypothetical protein
VVVVVVEVVVVDVEVVAEVSVVLGGGSVVVVVVDGSVVEVGSVPPVVDEAAVGFPNRVTATVTAEMARRIRILQDFTE